jgi:hypothetical protein
MRRGLLIAVVTLFVVDPARSLAAPSPIARQCADDAFEGQGLRNTGRLLAARERFDRCRAAACPAIVAADCEGFHAAVTSDLASVVITVTGGAEATVFVDGTLAAKDRLIELDPGVHRIAAREATSGRLVEVRIELAKGERGRVVPFDLRPLAKPVDTEVSRSPSVPTGALALAGVGLAFLATGVAVNLAAASHADELRGRCGLACPAEEVHDLQRRIVASYVLSGIGIGALGAGAGWYALSTKTRVTGSATAGGALVALVGTF